jgi:hypothetical protein
MSHGSNRYSTLAKSGHCAPERSFQFTVIEASALVAMDPQHIELADKVVKVAPSWGISSQFSTSAKSYRL